MSIKSKSFQDSIKRNNPYFEDFITRSIYHTNAIEGSTMSYYETYQIVFNGKSEEAISMVKPRELYEAINLKYAMDYLFRHMEEPLQVREIEQYGILINKNIHEIDGFRTSQVFIRGADHIPPDAADIPRLLQELLYTSFKTDDFFRDLADFHIRFERIHPFTDGNGRTGRILLQKQLLQHGYVPCVVPKECRTEYMNCLAEQDAGKLAVMIQKFVEDEKIRIKKFGIALEEKEEISHEQKEEHRVTVDRNPSYRPGRRR